MDTNRFDHVFYTTRKIIAHQREKEILRGETFNIFSVLGMESKENKTHSSFICELLNPKGSHLKGNIFLQYFLDVIKYNGLDISSTWATTEHTLGLRDDIDKKGGRIDIYLLDNHGKSVSIENKIYASDQYAQIERYCNYEKIKNKVFYLTLLGVEPTLESKGNLKSGTDFFLISYEKHISEWLNLCLKESVDIPILRETIKQYLILIKKLTNTMDKTEEIELFEMILKNYDEASIISNNILKAVSSLAQPIREKVFEKLKNVLKDKYRCGLAGDFNGKDHVAIFLTIEGEVSEKILFGLQTFGNEPTNEYPNGVFIGIYIYNAKYKPEYLKLGRKFNNLWIDIQKIKDYNGYEVSMNNSRTLKELYKNPEFQNGFINHIVIETIQYLDQHYDSVLSFLK